MKKLVALLGLAGILVAGGAMAQIDPDLDMLGIYFDEDATVFCTDYPIGGGSPAYLCLTNPSVIGVDPTQYAVSGWECAIGVTEGIFILNWGMRGDGPINFSAAPDFIVGLSTPTSWSPVIVLMEITVGVFAPGAIEFTLFPAGNSSFDPPSPGYATGDDENILVSLGYSAGGEGVICAVINGDCNVTASEDQTWGAVKSLYR